VKTRCGQRAADWQLQFSLLLSDTMPRTLDVIRRPDNLHYVTQLLDCHQYANGIVQTPVVQFCRQVNRFSI